MKRQRHIQSSFVRFRIKKNEKDWTTISLEPELVELMKIVFDLRTDEEIKEFVNRLANEIDFNFVSYSQEVKREIFKRIKERYETLHNLIQPKLIQ